MRFYDIPRSTIQYTLTQESKRQKQESLPRLGQPRKLTEDDRDNIYGIMQETPSFSTEKLLAEVDFKVHRQSIWRLTHQMGLRKWRKMHRPALKPIHAEKRLRWARRWQYLEPSGWACVYFSDECIVERGIGARHEWTFTRPKDQLNHHPIEGPQVQMVPSRGKQVCCDMRLVQIRNQAALSELAPKCLYRRPSWLEINLANCCCIYRLMYPSEMTSQFIPLNYNR